MKKEKRQLGFTLVEVAVSIALLAVVLLGVYKFASETMIYGQETGAKIQAYYLAAQGIEAVRSYNRQVPSPELKEADYYPKFHADHWELNGSISDGDREIKLDNLNFHRTVNINNESGLKKITSMVYWGSSDTDPRKQIILITYMKD